MKKQEIIDKIMQYAHRIDDRSYRDAEHNIYRDTFESRNTTNEILDKLNDFLKNNIKVFL